MEQSAFDKIYEVVRNAPHINSLRSRLIWYIYPILHFPTGSGSMTLQWIRSAPAMTRSIPFWYFRHISWKCLILSQLPSCTAEMVQARRRRSMSLPRSSDLRVTRCITVLIFLEITRNCARLRRLGNCQRTAGL